MRKTISLAIAVALCSTSLQSWSAEDSGNTLRLYNWSDYIGENTLADFEKETGIKVIYDVFDSYETVQGKLAAGHTGYDLVVLNASLGVPMIKANAFQPLQKEKLPNWKNLDPSLIHNAESYDPGLVYSAPYLWGSSGITYNVDMIKQRMPDAPIGSLAMIFDPKVVSHFADCGVSILDTPTEVIPLALAYLGKNPNSNDPEDYQAAKQVLMAVRPYIRKYDSTNYLNGLPNGDICMAMTWSGDYAVATARAEEVGKKINLAYFLAREGSSVSADNMYIPSDALHVDNAHKFLDYLLRPQVIADVTNYVGYANFNKLATPLVNEDIRNDPAIYPDAETSKRLFPLKPLNAKSTRDLNRVWTSVKTGT